MDANPKPQSIRRSAPPIAAAVLIALLWPVSYFWSEGCRFIIASHRLEFTTGPGWIAFTRGIEPQDIKRPPWFQNSFIWIDQSHRSALAYTRIYSLPGDYRFYFPLWMLSMAMAVLAIGLGVSSVRRRWRYKPGCCEKCGYDLRATRERCPECGSPVGKPGR